MKRAGELPESAGGGSQPHPQMVVSGVSPRRAAGAALAVRGPWCVSDLQNLGHLPASVSDRQEPEGPTSILTAREAGREWGLLRRGPQPSRGACQRPRWSSEWTGAGMFPWQQVSGHSYKTDSVPGLLVPHFLE